MKLSQNVDHIGGRPFLETPPSSPNKKSVGLDTGKIPSLAEPALDNGKRKTAKGLEGFITLSHDSVTQLPVKIGGRLILSVDDERTIRYTREIILQQEGYRVLSAANGAEALKLFESHPVDLVLLDYYLPGIDGGIVAAALKRRRPHVPIIMVSGCDHLSDRTRGPVDAFVTKGNGPGLLMERIKELLKPKMRRRA